jgi:hypothetical protein
VQPRLIYSAPKYRLAIFLFFTERRPALGPTQPPIQWVPGALSPGVKLPGREANHSPPTNAEVKNGGAIPPLPPYAFIESRVCGDYTRRGLDCQLDLLESNRDTLYYSVYSSQPTRSWVSVTSFQAGNHNYGIPYHHETPQPRTPAASVLSASLSEIYELWTDCREDTAFGIVDCLAVTRKRLLFRPTAYTLPSNVRPTACTSQ